MCGIAGYVGAKKVSEVLLNCLRRLEYRGYDSTGICVLSENGLVVRKDVGEVEDVSKRLNFLELEGKLGICHTRWATTGEVKRENAHPHLSCDGKVAVVHNGIISNHRELKRKLAAKGHSFSSETDSEVIAHLVEEHKRCFEVEEAFRRALLELRGTFAVAMIAAEEPDKIYCARLESPLLIGVGQGEMFISSDLSSFLPYTKQAVVLDDWEYAVVSQGGFVVKDLRTGEERRKAVRTFELGIEEAKKDGFDHYMLKEIFEQPLAAKVALEIASEELKSLAEDVWNAEKVFLTGTGTSLHACMVAEYWFAKAGKQVFAVDSSELEEKCLVDEDSLVIAVTQSGETYDTLSAMRHSKRLGARVAAIVNVLGSTATRVADYCVTQGSGLEMAVCATKTYVSQLVLLLRTANNLSKLSGAEELVSYEELRRLPQSLEDILRNSSYIKDASSSLRAKNYVFIGRGINYPTALEGALKFKEVTYLHAEGMPAGFLKHGTLSLIDGDLQTVALVAKGDERTLSNLEEVKARGGFVAAITNWNSELPCDLRLEVPTTSNVLTPITFVVPCQLLAYYKAVSLGNNPDKPRALAKSVTTP